MTNIPTSENFDKIRKGKAERMRRFKESYDKAKAE